jgi:hypothetical protein
MESVPSPPALAVRAAIGVALLAALGFWFAHRVPIAVEPSAGFSSSSPPNEAPRCPRGMLPDDGLCLALPAAEAPTRAELARADDASGIGLLPERPADYAAYRLPVTPTRIEPLPDGVRLHVPARAPVYAPTLEDQVGLAEVLMDAASPTRLVALYTVRRPASERRYLVVLSPVHVELAEREHALAAGTHVGSASSEPRGSSVMLSVRQLRQTTDSAQLSASQLLEDAHSIPCDPRNVLLRRAP